MALRSFADVKAELLGMVERAADGEPVPEMDERAWQAIVRCADENGDPAAIVEWVIKFFQQTGRLNG